MYSFKNDYSEGAHPRILQALAETNMEQADGYGEDSYTKRAIQLLGEKIGRKDAHIHLLPGGTQTNLTAISAFLKPYEAVVAANTGHILVHETGAIEATGHKIISVDTADGKLSPHQIQPVLDFHTDEHMVKPRLLYISNSTEVGTVYSKKELEELSGFCRKNSLLLYVDGARLGSALCARGNDLELSDLGKLADAFYIGGTKNGALLGEALVICTDSLKADFRFHIKQKGALLAKGKLLGVQFLELFRDNLYFDLAQHANDMAFLLQEGIADSGYSFLMLSPSNQVFPVFPNCIIEKLQENFSFYIWSKADNESSVVRLVTSWATRKEMVLQFVDELKNLKSACM